MAISKKLMLPQLIEMGAKEAPGRLLVQEATGRRFTYGDISQAAGKWTEALSALGMAVGDRIATMVETGGDWLGIWMGISQARGVEVPINTAFHGTMLQRTLKRARTRIAIVSSKYAQVLTSKITGDTELQYVVVLEDGESMAFESSDHLKVVRATDCFRGSSEQADSGVEPWDLAALVLTSGTTGLSKFVSQPWGMYYQAACQCFGAEELGEQDVFYIPLPAFHVAMRYYLYAAVLAGCSVVLRHRFSMSDFWSDVRAYNCTAAAIFPFARIIYDQDPSPADGDNPLRWVWMGPVIPEYREFADRFGVNVRTSYGMTEIGLPVISVGALPPNADTCGRLRPEPAGLEVRIVDEHDQEVECGQVGELIIRSSEPWCLNSGYFDMPAETAIAWRNGWFHTGDALRADNAGNLYFVDRFKDMIRRRGENISSFEVEALVRDHPGVRDCAAVAMGVANGESDVRIFVVRKSEDLTELELFEWLRLSMPKFMLPRYIEFVKEFPVTDGSARVKKHELRARPISPGSDFNHLLMGGRVKKSVS